MHWKPRSELLTFEELARVARIAVERFDFDAIRLTGGEPLVRARLPVLVSKLAALDVDLALTTNGSTLSRDAHALATAGLGRINVSLDTLRPDRFLEMTRRDQLGEVLDGIRAAVGEGLRPVKVNCVVVRGRNDDEIVDLARFGRGAGVTVRFIEFIPLDADRRWARDAVVPAAEIVAAVDEVFPLEPAGVDRGAEPAERHVYRDGAGEIGVIGTVTEPFCASCDRVRLTADGQLRACLFATDETDLRALLRGGSDDDGIAEAMADTVAVKWAGHGITRVDFRRPARSMSEIGG